MRLLWLRKRQGDRKNIVRLSGFGVQDLGLRDLPISWEEGREREGGRGRPLPFREIRERVRPISSEI